MLRDLNLYSKDDRFRNSIFRDTIYTDFNALTIERKTVIFNSKTTAALAALTSSINTSVVTISDYIAIIYMRNSTACSREARNKRQKRKSDNAIMSIITTFLFAKRSL